MSPSVLAQVSSAGMSVQYTLTAVNSKTGQPSAYHKVWVDGGRARVEEYDSAGLVLRSVLLTDGQHGYMYTPRTHRAVPFSGVLTMAGVSSAFATEAFMQAAWGGVARAAGDETVRGTACHVYKVGGLMAWFDAASGTGVRYGSTKDAATPGGTFFSDVRVPADSDNALYTLPVEAQLAAIPASPGIGGR
jgi:hypothetical protein